MEDQNIISKPEKPVIFYQFIQQLFWTNFAARDQRPFALLVVT